ncbi:hypothetical protein F7725_008078 [Dissostichus mawsoni]|uniref:DNA-binding protein inhibitor ID-4 n=1 Tax=Dissostichus mawsoni TaxID=36200 RepID=A0A7J5Y655_DISMA|nr:hypothetical protein F7725_008078 [Dissostichus mawsoni]
MKAISPVRSFRKTNANLSEHSLGISRSKTPVDDPLSLLYNMNDCYSKLKELVPSIPQNKNVSKMEILQHVIDYILDLQIALDSSVALTSLHHPPRPGQAPSRTPLTTLNTDISILSLQSPELPSELMTDDSRTLHLLWNKSQHQQHNNATNNKQHEKVYVTLVTQSAAPQRALSISSPRLMVRRFWLWMAAVVVLAVLLLPGVMMTAGESSMLEEEVVDSVPVMLAGCRWLLLVVLLPGVQLRLPTPLDGQPSSGLLAMKLASDAASEQMDMRTSCRPLRLLGRRPLFFTRPSSSSSIRLGFRASPSPSASSRERSEELSLERIPESDESFLSRRISERKPGLASSPLDWTRSSSWRRGVVLSASSGPESSSLGSLWYRDPAPFFLEPGVLDDVLWSSFSSSSLMGSRGRASAPEEKSVASLVLEPLLLKDLRLSWSAPSLACREGRGFKEKNMNIQNLVRLAKRP